MNNEPKKRIEHKKDNSKKLSKSAPLSYSDIIDNIGKLSVDSAKVFDDCVALFISLRELKDLSNDQVRKYFDLANEKLEHLWIPFLTKITVILCQSKHGNDSKFIFYIRTKCKEYLAKYGILESSLTNAEKNLCLLNKSEFVSQFLDDALKSNVEAQKNNQEIVQISYQDLSCLSFICLSLYCRQNQQDNDYYKSQLLIDRAIAEFFSSPELSKIKRKELAGKTLGSILSAKIFSQKKISELTYLYAGTTEKLLAQEERIQALDEIRRDQFSRINNLLEEIKVVKEEKHTLEEEIFTIKMHNDQLVEERNAAENMLGYEKNKFEKQLQSQEAGLAGQISADISLELQALRELVEYLGEDDQRRFRRRLDRIDRYLQEFGGEQ